MEKNTDNNNSYLLKNNIRDLELFVVKNQKRIAESEIQDIDIDLQNKYEEIFNQLSEVESDKPEKIIKIALDSVDSLERQQFVLSNLLEAIKKGENYNNVISRYNEIGLTNINISQPVTEPQNIPNNIGSSLWDSMRSVKNIAVTLYKIIVNSIKSIPKFIELKPRVGLSGMFPTISFEIEGSGIDIQEFFDIMSN